MKRLLSVLLTGIVLVAANQPATVCAETETIDLKALAKKARPAVMLLVVSDANGKEIATGTGFLVSSDGKLITNFHVIEKAASAVAKAENGGLFPVEGVLASDPKNDLVLLKLKGKELPFLTLGKSENIEVGTRIAVIGSPLGLEGTLSEGIVSAVREVTDDIKVLQVSAAISPGSSGSPVLNAKGDVIGIACAQIRGGQALNFAIPVAVAMRILGGASKPHELRSLSESAKIPTKEILRASDTKSFIEATRAGKHTQALKSAKNLIRDFPANSLSYFACGLAYMNLKFYSDSELALKQAIKLRPDFGSAWLGLDVVYHAQGKTELRNSAIQQLTSLNPQSHDLFDNPLVRIGSLAFLSRRIEIDPRNPMMYWKRGNGLLSDGDSNGAISDFNKSIQLRSQSTSPYLSRARAKSYNGDYAGALADINYAIRLSSTNAHAYNSRAWTLFMMGNLSSALTDANKAIELDSQYSNAYGTRGWIEFAAGDIQKAKDDCRKAVELARDTSVPLYDLGMLSFIDGEYEKAIAYWEEARERSATTDRELRLWIQKAREKLKK